jgi:hypothetical protein
MRQFRSVATEEDGELPSCRHRVPVRFRKLRFDLTGAHRGEECVGLGDQALTYHGLGLRHMGVRAAGGRSQRARALGGEHRPVVGPYHVDAGREASPVLRCPARVGGAERGAPAGPGVGVEDRLLDHNATLVVPNRVWMVEALGVEVGLRDRALAERRAEDTDGVGSSNVPGLEADAREDSFQRAQGLCRLGCGRAGGDSIAEGGAVGLLQGVVERVLSARSSRAEKTHGY